MDFSLTDDHLALRDAVLRFCAGEYLTHERGNVESLERAAQRHAGMAELGLLGLMVPASHGGSGLGSVEAMLVAQELGSALAGSSWLASAVLAAPLIARAASAAQRARWLPGVADGTLRVALACHEAEARYDLGRVAARAARRGERWQLSGRKALVLDGDAAALVLVVARTGGKGHDRDGLALFAIPSSRLKVQPFRLLDGRGAAHIDTDGVEACDEDIIAHADRVLPLVEAAVARAEAALVAECVGALDALLITTCEHLKTRQQFGLPLAKFQVLQHQVAEMAMALEQLKSMACVAALACDLPDGRERERERLISSAKVLTAQLGRRCALAAIQLHGAMGMTDECRAGRYAKRLLTNGMLFGDASTHLQRVIERTRSFHASAESFHAPA